LQKGAGMHRALQLLSGVVVAAMAAATGYALYTSVVYWSGIGV
jgi:hypothetical protein